MRGPDGGRSPLFAFADAHIDEVAALDPVRATAMGVPGHDHRLTDYSPVGIEARREQLGRARVRLATFEIGEEEVTAHAVMDERLASSVALADAGEPYRAVRNIGSPVQAIRQVFDLMPRATVDDWEAIAARMGEVPAALAGLWAGLDEGRGRGLVAARRQVEVAAEQAATWAGHGAGTAFFAGLADDFAALAIGDDALARDLEGRAGPADEAYGVLADRLRHDYLPDAGTRDAVGEERYRRFIRASLGLDLDPIETYAWGWEELHRLEDEMAVTADRVVPGATVSEAIEHLETDPGRSIDGEDALRSWLQDLMDRTIDELDGVHFDIPEPIRRVEAMIAPAGGAAAMYYTPPSEDLERPGRTWYPTLGKSRFPLWGEVSIAYHEGVPGHHLQLAQVRLLHDRLTRFQRLTSIAGHAEGWALYAERLMDELGYLDDPAHRLGMLRAQVMRAVRVVVDIGMHLELDVPTDESFHPGERWTAALGQEFVDARSCFPPDFMASEIVRYLGWPAQAISYKVGEREFLARRAEAERRAGSDFDLKDFHQRILDLGSVPLEVLRGVRVDVPGPSDDDG